MPSRFYVSDLPNRQAISLPHAFSLPVAVSHHLDRVLRLKEGEAIVLFDGQGGEWLADIVQLGKQVQVSLRDFMPVEREIAPRVTLVQSLASGDKMDWIVQKAVELGVAAIQPIAAERSVLKLSGDRATKRQQHWQDIAISACEQCGGNRIPEVLPVMEWSRWLAQSTQEDYAVRWILDPLESQTLSQQTVITAAQPSAKVAVLIGPEGGFSPKELEQARQAGCQALRLGQRILRTETAGLTVLAALSLLTGEF